MGAGTVGLCTVLLCFHNLAGTVQEQQPYLALKGTEASCGLGAAVLLGKDGLGMLSLSQPVSA